MRIEEAVESMTKLYLQRIIDSFTKDFPKPNQSRAREIIVDNSEELTDPDRIARQLRFEGKPYSRRVLYRYALEVLLDDHDNRADEGEIVEAVTSSEQEIIGRAEDADSLQYEDDRAVDILRTVFEVATEDEEISGKELNLVSRLWQHLGVQEKTAQVILAQLEHFPRAGNELHSPSEITDALKDLQQKGVVFYCNRLDEACYLIPEEIVPGVKRALGFELGEDSWRLLLDHLTKSQLATILEANGLPKYGRKAKLIERIVTAGLQPSSALGQLSREELYELLDGLPGANVSGTKPKKIERLLTYFSKLVIKETDKDATPGERYYEYLVELAHRDRENLLANDVVKKDRDMDAAFEIGIRYLFTEKLGVELLEMSGSDHPDGALEFGAGRQLLMWDTKSKEDTYRFPRSHLRQFKRYIRDSARRVSCFLVIVPEVGEGAEDRAARLKIESRSDTDVALIAAEDLKWMAEEWDGRTKEAEFDAEVFNVAGVLDRSTLTDRVEMFL